MILHVYRPGLASRCGPRLHRGQLVWTNGWLGNHILETGSTPRFFHTTGSRLDTGKLEEQAYAWYKDGKYYPARIGDVLRSRYRILGKLGYGAHSTVWLGRDLHEQRYVTLKICERNSNSAPREMGAYQHLVSLQTTTTHPGAQLVRQLLDSFELQRSGGRHICMVHEPLGMGLRALRKMLPEEKLPEQLLKSILKNVLLALDYLHTECMMVHTDLQARNFLFRVENDTVFQNFEKAELEHPSAFRTDAYGDRIVYESRDLGLRQENGPAVLCDFGEARFGNASYLGDIQPYVYRAPEVVLEAPWSYEVDIWNVGVMIWDLFEDQHLFSAMGPSGGRRIGYHIAEMVAILGIPPVEFLQRSKTAWRFFNADGTWKPAVSIPKITLEAAESRLTDGNKARFLEFVRKMLRWLPEERQTAKQLLGDPWLNS